MENWKDCADAILSFASACAGVAGFIALIIATLAEADWSKWKIFWRKRKDRITGWFRFRKRYIASWLRIRKRYYTWKIQRGFRLVHVLEMTDKRPVSVLKKKKIKEYEDLLEIIWPYRGPIKLRRTAKVKHLHKLMSLIEEWRRMREYNQEEVRAFRQNIRPILNPDPKFRGSWDRPYMIRPGLAKLKAEVKSKEDHLKEEIEELCSAVFKKISYREFCAP
ncbi:MAG: hypothetical protein ACOZAL_00070 [Patescibacteria group bacterium]